MDTVKVRARGVLDSAIVQALDHNMHCRQQDWIIQRIIRPEMASGCPVRRFIAIHHDPHIYVTGTEDQISRASFHLPEILHGYNGIQIKSAIELDAALDRAQALITEITNSPVGFGVYERVDFAYNLPCKSAEILNTLKLLRHPYIRKSQLAFQDNGVQLLGKAFVFSGYIKSHRRTNRKGFPLNKHPEPTDNHLRLEVQARTSQAVSRLCGQESGTPVGKLDFFQLWRGFWTFIGKFPKFARTSVECSETTLIALLEQNNIRLPDGRSAIEWWAEGKKSDTIRKKKSDVSRTTFSNDVVQLIDRIPETPPVEYLDVLPDGTTRTVRNEGILPIISYT